MPEIVTVGAAQLGPIQRADDRPAVVARMIALLHQAKEAGCQLVVFPELALTTFFPRWWMEDEEALPFFERSMPSNETAPLFETARALGLAFSFGFAELTDEGRRFNTQILVGPDGRERLRYRKIHLPGHADNQPWRPFQHLEKHYFEPGDLSWPVVRIPELGGGVYGQMICNDRRWPEAWRVMGLQAVDMVLLGYNTPRHNPPTPEHDRLSDFHNHLVMQAGAYQNATFVVGVAKAGIEEGCDLIGGTVIIAPTGEIMAQAVTQGDELVVARCDLAMSRGYRENVFNFARHREPGEYRRITEQKGAVAPD